ncbi:hypothetical protein RMATCC62417_18754 [Rhizopus microsporus]|nr:hypothetical protein RMATCC62417_18754 [Rhizopus microsporus]
MISRPSPAPVNASVEYHDPSTVSPVPPNAQPYGYYPSPQAGYADPYYPHQTYYNDAYYHPQQMQQPQQTYYDPYQQYPPVMSSQQSSNKYSVPHTYDKTLKPDAK